MEIVMLAFPIDPIIYKTIEDFLHVSPDRGMRGSCRRATYKKARSTFLDETIRLKSLNKITDLRKFVRAVSVLRKAPEVYRAHHSYMTKYQIVRLVGEAGTVNSKKFVKVFGVVARSNRKALLEIEGYLDSISMRRTYSADHFKLLEMNYY